ncbi:hypothetical protein V2O64_10335 [Verrucomicrobiaceae bacterium 227]
MKITLARRGSASKQGTPLFVCLLKRRETFEKLHRDLQSWIFTLNLNIARIAGSQNDQERDEAITQIKSLLYGSAAQQLFLPTFWGAGAFSTAALTYVAWLQASLVAGESDRYLIAGFDKFEQCFTNAFEQTVTLSDSANDSKGKLAKQMELALKNKRFFGEFSARFWG